MKEILKGFCDFFHKGVKGCCLVTAIHACASRICPQNWVGYDTNSDKCSF